MFTEIKLPNKGLLPKAQKAVAKNLLNRFLNEMPEGTIAYVAGGAPRDWHHGWGCRDLDIFYKIPDDANVDDILSKYTLIKNPYGYSGYGVGDSQGLLSVHEYDVKDYSRSRSMSHKKVQLIRTKYDPLEVITDFPISLSRIWMDKEGKIKCDFMYRIGYNNSTIYEIHGWNYVYLNKILGRFDTYVFMPKYWDRKTEEEKLA